MFVASIRVRRQLKRAPGAVRWASIIAGPKEFWTITMWETRDKMLDFMRSGAHEEIMWLFGKWLESFWLMRWRPTSEERGAWKGARLADRPALPASPLSSTPEAKAVLDAALEAMPQLRASVGPDGKASYTYSRFIRRRRQAVAGGVGVMMRLEVPHVWQLPRGWLDIRRMRRWMGEHPDVIRWVIGISRPRELYALCVVRDDPTCREFLSLPEHRNLTDRWGEAFWTMRWEADNEFGHWDGIRLRKERLGTAIPVPEEALQAAMTGGEARPIKAWRHTSRRAARRR